MPIVLPDGTQVKQRQVDKSASVNDSLAVPTLSYTNQKSLEDDLNYIRSILKQIKGTSNYDSPLVRSLDLLRQDMESVFNGATLSDTQLAGTPTASTPNPGDYSNRVATTSYVSDTINTILSGAPGDSRKVHNQSSVSDTWYVLHNLGKYPSVSVVDSANTKVEGKVVYIDLNSLEIQFRSPFSGKAFLN